MNTLEKLGDRTGSVLAVLTLFATWIWMIGHFGLLWGLALGWLPAFILAVLVGTFWPYALALGVLGLLLVVLHPLGLVAHIV